MEHQFNKAELARFRLKLRIARCPNHRSNSTVATKTTFVCDCCFREADSNPGWAHVSVNGASDGKQLMPDVDRDRCEICWSPLQTLMTEVQDKARELRNVPKEGR